MKKLLGQALSVLLLLSGLAAAANAATPPASSKTPKAVAQRLYQAWRLRTRVSAQRVAAPEAVDKLFGVKWRTMNFEGCRQREEGGFECIYRDAKNDFSLAMIVEGGASMGGYNVASVSFSTEE